MGWKQWTKTQRVWLTVAVAFFVCNIAYMGWLAYWCHSEASLKPDRFWIALAIIRMKDNPDPRHLEPVTPYKTLYLQRVEKWRVESSGAMVSDPVSAMLRAKGWRFVDQMGALRVYKNASGERLDLETRMFTIRYQTCTADRVP